MESAAAMGVKTLAVACNEEVRTIEDIYEPYLIQCGFLKRTARGRMATPRAFAHLHLCMPASMQIQEQGRLDLD